MGTIEDEKTRFKINFRGVGKDMVKKCFVCGCDTPNFTHNISGFTSSKEVGEAIVKCFLPDSARVDFRENEPDWIQVKIGTCNEHVNSLFELHRLCRGGDLMLRDIRLAQIVPAKLS